MNESINESFMVSSPLKQASGQTVLSKSAFPRDWVSLVGWEPQPENKENSNAKIGVNKENENVHGNHACSKVLPLIDTHAPC